MMFLCTASAAGCLMTWSVRLNILALAVGWLAHGSFGSAQSAAPISAEVGYAAHFWEACTDPAVHHIQLLPHKSWEDFRAELRAPCAIDRALLVEGGWTSGGRAIRLNMGGMVDKLVVTSGADLHIKDVWLDNFLSNTRPYLAPLALTAGGKAVFENVEFSDGNCMATYSSEGIQGLLRSLGWGLYGGRDPEKPDGPRRVTLMRPTVLAGLAYNSSYRFTNCTLSCTGIGPDKLPKPGYGQEYFPLIGSWIVGILIAIVSIRYLWLAVPGLLDSESETSWSHTDGIPAAVANQAERYHVRLIEPLGQGMFGKVYKGIFDSAYVAVKVLEFSVQGDRSTTTASAEISLATSLLHPYVVETHLCIVDVISVGDLFAAQQTGTDTGVAVSTYRASTSSLSTTSGSAMAPQMSHTRPPTDSYDPVPFTIMAHSPDPAVLGTLTSQQTSGRTPHSGNSGAVDDWLERQHRTLQDEHSSLDQLDGSSLAPPISTRDEVERQLHSSMASMPAPADSEITGGMTNAPIAFAQSSLNLNGQRGGGDMPSPDAMTSFSRGGSSTTSARESAGGPTTGMGVGEATVGHSSSIEMFDRGRNGSTMERRGAGPQPDSDLLAGRITPSKPVPIPTRGLASAVQRPTDRTRAIRTMTSPLASSLQQAHADRTRGSQSSGLGLLQRGIGSAREPPHALPILSGEYNAQHRGSTLESLPETASGGSSGSWVRLAHANPSPSQVWERSPDSDDGVVRGEQGMTSHASASQRQGPMLVPAERHILGPISSGSGGFVAATQPDPSDTTGWPAHGQAPGTLRVGDATDARGAPRGALPERTSIPDMSRGDQAMGLNRTGSSTAHVTESPDASRPKPVTMPQDSAMSHGVAKLSSPASLTSDHIGGFRPSEESAYSGLWRPSLLMSEQLSTSSGGRESLLSGSYTHRHGQPLTGTDGGTTSGSSELFGQLESDLSRSREDARSESGVRDGGGLPSYGSQLQGRRTAEHVFEEVTDADNMHWLGGDAVPPSSQGASHAGAAVLASARSADVRPGVVELMPLLGRRSSAHGGSQVAGEGPAPPHPETLSSSPLTTEGSLGGHDSPPTNTGSPTEALLGGGERTNRTSSSATAASDASPLQDVQRGGNESDPVAIRTRYNSHVVIHMQSPGAGGPSPVVGGLATQTGSLSSPSLNPELLPDGSWLQGAHGEQAISPSPLRTDTGVVTVLSEVSGTPPGRALAQPAFGPGMRALGSSFSRRAPPETMPRIEEGQAPTSLASSSSYSSEESVRIPISAFIGHAAASSPLAAENESDFDLRRRSFSGAHDPLGRLESEHRAGSEFATAGAAPEGDEARGSSVQNGSMGSLRAYRCMIVMEFCDKGTLWAALRQHIFHSPRGRPDMPLILRIAHEIATALGHLHGLRILHRDITSRNILLQTGREDGLIHAKVSDFGLSVLLETDQAYATTQQRGTLGYCGPEVLTGDQLSLQTDVYSFGVILWELYTAATPYEGMNETQIVLRKVLSGPDLDPPLTCPTAYAQLIHTCMQRNAKARPSFKAIADRLQTLQDLRWD